MFIYDLLINIYSKMLTDKVISEKLIFGHSRYQKFDKKSYADHILLQKSVLYHFWWSQDILCALTMKIGANEFFLIFNFSNNFFTVYTSCVARDILKVENLFILVQEARRNFVFSLKEEKLPCLYTSC